MKPRVRVSPCDTEFNPWRVGDAVRPGLERPGYETDAALRHGDGPSAAARHDRAVVF
ncbi:hypothetical protein [Prosthecobacter sp.]